MKNEPDLTKLEYFTAAALTGFCAQYQRGLESDSSGGAERKNGLASDEATRTDERRRTGNPARLDTQAHIL